MHCGLRRVARQENTIFDAIDKDKSGTIEHAEFFSFLRDARTRIDAKEAKVLEKNDARNMDVLVKMLLKDVSAQADVLEPILRDVESCLSGTLRASARTRRKSMLATGLADILAAHPDILGGDGALPPAPGNLKTAA